MNGTGAPVNSAGGNSRVGVQAQAIYDGVTVVHGDMRYETPPDASPEEKYRIGLNNLDAHMATKARDLIWDAMMHGYESSEVMFHWLLAMLSGRTIRQFSTEELAQVKHADGRSSAAEGDPWATASRLIFQLLAAVGLLSKVPKPEISQVVKEFETLGVPQREKLLPHLELFLDGPLKDAIWRRELSAAAEGQLGGRRTGRAWMFFQPIPMAPRVPRPRPVSTGPAERLVAGTSAGIFAAAALCLGWELLTHGAVMSLLAYLIGLVGAAVAVVNGLDLCFLAERRRRKDEQILGAVPPAATGSRSKGFADQVDVLFDRYSAKYIPDAAERASWQVAAAGQRKFDRDEIVTEYRESRIPAERVAWLIRYRIRQSRDNYRSGDLYSYRDQLRPMADKAARCWIGLAVAVLGAIGAILFIPSWRLVYAASIFGVVLIGAWAWRLGLQIYRERRHFEADKIERDKRVTDTQAEYARWTSRLKDRPSDSEMASWLDFDRTMLLGQAMDHFKLARSHVIAHAFLEEPGSRARRARVRSGPMRYSKYTLIVFLLTADGVRQVWADLGFLTGTLRKGDRLSYRYDAVASAHVSLTGPSLSPRIQQTLKLTLVNGEPINVIVADLDPIDFQQGEDADSLSKATLDAASVTNTLHVLEGIAAEGKGWFRERKADQGIAS